MSSTWIFQANPEQYRIDDALGQLSVIDWRVPQHTGEIRPGDEVLIWRAGRHAGAVGVGRVTSYPRESEPTIEDASFMIASGSVPQKATRVLVKARAIPFVPKARFQSLAGLAHHQILSAPMGTVFRLTEAEWAEMGSLAPDLLEIDGFASLPGVSEWPRAFAWRDRRKAVYPLPGGQEHYLDTLGEILEWASAHPVGRADVEAWLQARFVLAETSARFVVDFLQRLTLIAAAAGRVEVTPEAKEWLASRNPGHFVALLHSRVRFVGEMMRLLREPRTVVELLALANQEYAMGWASRAQIDRRRAWLHSSGAVNIDEEGRLYLSNFGAKLLGMLEVQLPLTPEEQTIAATPEISQSQAPPTEPVVVGIPSGRTEQAQRLIGRLREVADQHDNPSWFEEAATEAFAFLGFDATWLGGSGKTDVLLVAELGPGERYRVIIDCKTTGRDAVQDQQVDWITLREHKQLHEADYVAVLARAFGGSRVRARAKDQGVLLVDLDALETVLLQHVEIPMGLDVYRKFFEAPDGTAGAEAVAEDGDESARWLRVTSEILRCIQRLEGSEGSLSARDLYWNLRALGEDLGSFTTKEIEIVLSTLSSPALGILRRVGEGYRTVGSLRTAAARLEVLAVRISEGTLEHLTPNTGSGRTA